MIAAACDDFPNTWPAALAAIALCALIAFSIWVMHR